MKRFSRSKSAATITLCLCIVVFFGATSVSVPQIDASDIDLVNVGLDYELSSRTVKYITLSRPRDSRRIDALVGEFNAQRTAYSRGGRPSPISFEFKYRNGKVFGWGISPNINTYVDPDNGHDTGERIAIPFLVDNHFEETCALVTSKANCDIAKRI